MDYKFETRCIHRENEHEEGHPYGSVCTPIYQTATFYHPGIGQTTGFNFGICRWTSTKAGCANGFWKTTKNGVPTCTDSARAGWTWACSRVP